MYLHILVKKFQQKWLDLRAAVVSCKLRKAEGTRLGVIRSNIRNAKRILGYTDPAQTTHSLSEPLPAAPSSITHGEKNSFLGPVSPAGADRVKRMKQLQRLETRLQNQKVFVVIFPG